MGMSSVRLAKLSSFEAVACAVLFSMENPDFHIPATLNRDRLARLSSFKTVACDVFFSWIIRIFIHR